MSLLLGQLVYTSFHKVGFRLLASAKATEEIQQAFMEKIVDCYWKPYSLPKSGYRAVYLRQVTPEQTLFGWLYNSGLDEFGRNHVPYFICYYLPELLCSARLEHIFACLERGPATLIDRWSLPAILDIVIPDAGHYQPACTGVTVASEIRDRSYIALQQQRLLNLFIPANEGGIVNNAGKRSKRLQQGVPLSNVNEVSFMTQPSSPSNQSQAAANKVPQENANESTVEIVSKPRSTGVPANTGMEGDTTPFPQHSHGKELALSQANRPSLPNESTSTRRHSSPQQQGWGLKAKVTAWALAVSMLPVLVVGAATYYVGNQSMTRYQDSPVGTTRLEDTTALQRQLTPLLVGTGVMALLSGAIATVLAGRLVRPIVKAAETSNTMVNRLRREQVSTWARVVGKDELVALKTNINLMGEHLLDLLWKQEAGAEPVQMLMTITHRIQESLSEEDVLRTSVREARNALRADRVVIFRFDANWDGTFVEESVAPGWPKTLWSTVSDPCFEGGYVEQYRNGRVRAIDDIYQADLNDCHIGLLERFAVKANLIAPITINNQLFGLLIAHQCSGPRIWQQPEIDLFTQLAMQVEFALDHARLLERLDAKAAQAQAFIDLTRQIRQSLIEEDILETTVEEVRRTLIADRVIVYSFDADWYGTVVAESVVPGIPRALRARIKDPCFAEGYVDQYREGRVQATNNIYEAGLTACHLAQLKPFAVQANLVAPILKDDKLFGLLIAHQCSGPRTWRQPEIDLFAQLAMQVGFALDQARLLTRVEAESVGTQLLSDLTRRIRQSLVEADVLKTTVEEVRKAIRTDRVIVYSFDADWYGTVVAESVLPGWPKVLRARIKDPCFAEGYVDQYREGRVQATNNIYEAGLTECHLAQLKPFAVQANLVAPILKDDKLFGLLIAHQCSGPRTWHQLEINLFAQLAMQVGFALDHARLLDQVEQAYQIAEATSHAQQQEKEVLQHRVSKLLNNSEAAIATLSTEALSQMELLKTAYNQIQVTTDSTRKMTTTAQQAELQTQQTNQTVQAGCESMIRAINGLGAVQNSFLDTAEKVKRLNHPSQKLSEVVNLLSNIVSQIKFQAINASLQAARSGEAGQEFTAIAEKVQSLAQQLEAGIREIKPLVGETQAGIHEIASAIETGTQPVMIETRLMQETQEKLNQIAAATAQIDALVKELGQAATDQAQTSTAASQSVLEIASIASHTSEQSLAVAESFTKLAATAQEG